ncbi:hypothetical protein FACS189449_11660 [Alphaproteobacteria bacterium]|nr:hypothetical protein FACS189449_11660 [Alphaproteobacteria bacterium]
MIQKLMNKPLLINPQSLASMMLDSLFLSVPKKDDLTVVASDVGNLKQKNSKTYNIHNSIAVIPIHGLFTKNCQYSSHFFVTTSYNGIHELIATALEDSKVNSILLDIDSPGGEVGGLFDLVDFIYESREAKPIYAFANDHAFSAAYAIAFCSI